MTETEQIQAVRAGDTDAFADLYIQHRPRALSLARRLGMDHEAEDAVDESFAQILRLMLDGRGPEETFVGYLVTTVRHECFRRQRARFFERATEPEDLDTSMDHPEVDRLMIRDALRSLHPRHRLAVWHCTIQGRPVPEVAEEFGLSSNGMSALLHRAKANLRTRLGSST